MSIVFYNVIIHILSYYTIMNITLLGVHLLLLALEYERTALGGVFLVFN